MELEPGKLKSIVRAILDSRPDEIGCEECFGQLDEFVDLALAGTTPAEAMPLVQQHLERCRDCRDAFKALLSALRAVG